MPATPRFVPSFHGPIEGYAIKAIHQLYPRVKHRFELDDLYQEAAETYLSCRRRYAHVDNPAWFMALYKQCLFTRFAALVGNCVKHRALTPLLEGYLEQAVEDAAELTVLLGQMPGELLEIIQALLADSAGVIPSRKIFGYRQQIEIYLSRET